MAQPPRGAWRGDEAYCSSVLADATTLAVAVGSVFAGCTAASLVAATFNVPSTPARAGAGGAAAGDGVVSIGAAAASVSANCSSGVEAANAAARSGSGFATGAESMMGEGLLVTALVTVFLGSTSLTVTVFTLTGVIGAFEPGTTGAGTSLARGGMTETWALSAEASCGFAT